MLKGSMDFDLPDLPKNLEKLTVRNLVEKQIPVQSELAMLRHYGFPSPLLDWTLSPFVAAYFAFSPKPSASCRHVAIFCYREFLGYGKLSVRGNAQIRAIGPWAPVNDERHIRQQSQYTVAIRDKEGEGVEFCPHEDAIRERPFKDVRFDEITKFILPMRIRDEVLSDLRRMNITEYSLFNTTDALVRTVARFAFSRP